jgi:integrase
MALDDSTAGLAPNLSPTRKPKGRHPYQRLTALEVRKLNHTGRHADGNGLYLEISETGARHWVLRTVVDGKRRDIGLGSALLVPLVKAREEARRLRELARAGGDPLLARRQARQAIPTFRKAAVEVHAHHSQTFRNDKHAREWLASLEAHVFPLIGDRAVDTIEPHHVLEVLTPFWMKTPETARRVKQRIKVVLDWAKASGYRRGDNPVDGVTKVLPKAGGTINHHAALPYAQLPAFLKSLRAVEATVLARLAFEFLILTAARTSEVRLASPGEIDRDAGTWTIPAERMKAKRAHQVPLSPRCLEIIEQAEPLAGDSPYLFPGRWLDKPLSEMSFLMLLRRMQRDDITAHGFRSTFRDWAAERTTFPRAVVEAALAHVVKDKTEAAYLRTKFFEQRRELMNTWAAFATTPSADVVPIRA